MSLLRQSLEKFCGASGWDYAVLWKVKHRSKVILLWEDGYSDLGAAYAHADKYSNKLNVDFDALTMSISRMSYHVHAFGEGMVGRAAVTGKHRWIFSPLLTSPNTHMNFRHSEESASAQFPAGWQQQFDLGIKTVALIPVAGGVLQLGSLDFMREDLKLVSYAISMFSALQKVPGVYLSDLIATEPPRAPSPEDNWQELSTGLLTGGEQLSLASSPFAEASGASSPTSSLPVFPPQRMAPSEDFHRVNQAAVAYPPLYQGSCYVQKVPYSNPSQLNSKADLLSCFGGMENMLMSQPGGYPAQSQELPTGGQTGSFLLSNLGSNPRSNSLCTQLAMRATSATAGNSPRDQFDSLSEDIGRYFTDGPEAVESPPDRTGLLNDKSPVQLQPWDKYMAESSTDALLKKYTPPTDSYSAELEQLGILLRPQPGQSQPLQPSAGISSQLLAEVLPSVATDSIFGEQSRQRQVPAMQDHQSFFSVADKVEFAASKMAKVAAAPLPQKVGRKRPAPAASAGESIGKMLPPMKVVPKVSKPKKPASRAPRVPKPRPKDRQLIQDRLKELREVIPETAKCSIDNVLNRTKKHIQFLQNSITQTQCFDEVEGMFGLRNAPDGRESDQPLQLGSSPFVIDCLPAVPNHFIIRVSCETDVWSLELTDSLNKLGLVIRRSKFWSTGGILSGFCIVQYTRPIQKAEVVWHLMRVLRPAGTIIGDEPTEIGTRLLSESSLSMFPCTYQSRVY